MGVDCTRAVKRKSRFSCHWCITSLRSCLEEGLMREHTRRRLMPAATFALILVSGVLLSAAVSDCTYLRNPDEFKFNKVRHYAERSATTDMVARAIQPRGLAPLD